jgi:ABC-type transport system involved in cytochrome c biogenesis ATPase subunit
MGVHGVIQRVFTEIIGKPFLRGLLFPYFLFLLTVSAADASTNWEAQRLQMSTLPPAVRTPLFVGLIGSWCLVAGRTLRPVWRNKTLPFLVRQPMGPWELSARLQDVHRHAPARRHISFVSANPELPDFLSVTEAYQFAASLRRVPDWNGRSLCAALNLDPSLTLANASAGQRQKAEFICALAGDPAVLLLDETFAHLDQASLARVCDWLRDWSTSRLIIFAHHGESPLEPHSILHVDRQSIVTLPRH